MTEEIVLDGKKFTGHRIATEHTALLLIQGRAGFLACTYLNAEVADRLGDAAAIVTGVKTFADMYEAKVIRVSKRAAELGVATGMTGREALLRLG
ncbi:MAG: DUF1805 domain-containing protein [Victivallales bacterium]|nr:DUF1805 domain-containing protein [Victivallales bacterium]